LYLPKAWTDDRGRMAKAGVPDDVGHRPKWEMALAMLRRAHANGFRGVVLADSLFGTVTEFRERLDADGRTYCVGIDSTLKVVAADADLGPIPPHSGRGRPPTRPSKVRAGATSPSVKEWALDHAGDFRTVKWREGSKGRMAGRFAAWRVRPAHKLSAGKTPLAACWLLAEWPEGADRYDLAGAVPVRRLVIAAGQCNISARNVVEGRMPLEPSEFGIVAAHETGVGGHRRAVGVVTAKPGSPVTVEVTRPSASMRRIRPPSVSPPSAT